MLVGRLFHQAPDLLGFVLRVAAVAKLAAVNPQAAAQFTFSFTQVRKGLDLANSQLFQGRPGGLFGNLTGLDHGLFQLST